MNGVKWISITTDIFNDEKMCAIESLPDGMSIEIVWFKILCLAGTCNENGFLMITRDIPYTDEMLAKNFRMDIGIIKRALEIFQKMGMIEIVDDIYMVSNWMKYQNNAELQHIKETNRLRQQRYRERQKEQLLIAEQNSNVTSNVTNDENNVTNNATNNEFCSIYNCYFLDIYKDIINYLNTKSNNNYRYKTKAYQKLIHARINEGFTITDLKTVIDKKCDDWIGTEFEKFLSPNTLFSSKHFEDYLNQKVYKKSNDTGSNLDSIDIGE